MTENPRAVAFALIVGAVVLSGTGELLLKKGVTIAGGVEYSTGGLLRVFTTWQVLVGFAFFFAGALVWLKVLSMADLSWAYPLLAIGYPLVVIGSFVFLGEAVNVQRVLGALLVLAGVFVTYHSWTP